MLLSSSLQPENMNPSLLPWAQAAIDRDQVRDLPNTNLAPSHQEGGISHGLEQETGDVGRQG